MLQRIIAPGLMAVALTAAAGCSRDAGEPADPAASTSTAARRTDTGASPARTTTTGQPATETGTPAAGPPAAGERADSYTGSSGAAAAPDR